VSGVIDTSTTVGDALAAATQRLRATSETPRLDAEVLFAHVTGRDRTWLLAHPEAGFDEGDAFGVAVERRASGEPVAYIRGFKEWRSLRIRTDARALIPRPETELVVETAAAEIVSRLTRQPTTVAWDVATGSGAIALALALDFGRELADGRLRLIASDISTEAIALAAENLEAHGVTDGVELGVADLLAPAGDRLPRPDLVTANLPYVSSAEVDARAGSLGFEPRVAVDGGPDGLDVMRRFLTDVPLHAAPGATLVLELGADQVDAVRRLAPVGASVSVVPDLAGLDRVVRIDLPG
jgi:release factor glutamine methyltransferase